jgi:hypothetical protein
MTLAQAVGILNKYRFLWCDTWHISGDRAVGTYRLETLGRTTAIAIAEAYCLIPTDLPATPTIEGATLVKVQRFLIPGTKEYTTVLTYSVQITPDPAVASYQISYTTTPTGSTTPGAPVVNSLSTGITCNPLDAVSVTATALGTDGASSAASAPFLFTAAAGPLSPTAPAAPVITGVTQTS